MTSGVDFFNILCAAFMHADPDRAKKTDNLTVFFALLGFKRVKAAHTHIGVIDHMCCGWGRCEVLVFG